jgi:hypothetical protein
MATCFERTLLVPLAVLEGMQIMAGSKPSCFDGAAATAMEISLQII